MPIIVVFTQYDNLFNQIAWDMDPARTENLDDNRINAIVEKEATEAFETLCILPLRKVSGKKVNYAKVSGVFSIIFDHKCHTNEDVSEA